MKAREFVLLQEHHPGTYHQPFSYRTNTNSANTSTSTSTNTTSGTFTTTTTTAASTTVSIDHNSSQSGGGLTNNSRPTTITTKDTTTSCFYGGQLSNSNDDRFVGNDDVPFQEFWNSKPADFDTTNNNKTMMMKRKRSDIEEDENEKGDENYNEQEEVDDDDDDLYDEDEDSIDGRGGDIGGKDPFDFDPNNNNSNDDRYYYDFGTIPQQSNNNNQKISSRNINLLNHTTSTSTTTCTCPYLKEYLPEELQLQFVSRWKPQPITTTTTSSSSNNYANSNHSGTSKKGMTSTPSLTSSSNNIPTSSTGTATTSQQASSTSPPSYHQQQQQQNTYPHDETTTEWILRDPIHALHLSSQFLMENDHHEDDNRNEKEIDMQNTTTICGNTNLITKLTTTVSKATAAAALLLPVVAPPGSFSISSRYDNDNDTTSFVVVDPYIHEFYVKAVCGTGLDEPIWYGEENERSIVYRTDGYADTYYHYDPPVAPMIPPTNIPPTLIDPMTTLPPQPQQQAYQQAYQEYHRQFQIQQQQHQYQLEQQLQLQQSNTTPPTAYYGNQQQQSYPSNQQQQIISSSSILPMIPTTMNSKLQQQPILQRNETPRHNNNNTHNESNEKSVMIAPKTAKATTKTAIAIADEVLSSHKKENLEVVSTDTIVVVHDDTVAAAVAGRNVDDYDIDKKEINPTTTIKTSTTTTTNQVHNKKEDEKVVGGGGGETLSTVIPLIPEISITTTKTISKNDEIEIEKDCIETATETTTPKSTDKAVSTSTNLINVTTTSAEESLIQQQVDANVKPMEPLNTDGVNIDVTALGDEKGDSCLRLDSNNSSTPVLTNTASLTTASTSSDPNTNNTTMTTSTTNNDTVTRNDQKLTNGNEDSESNIILLKEEELVGVEEGDSAIEETMMSDATNNNTDSIISPPPEEVKEEKGESNETTNEMADSDVVVDVEDNNIECHNKNMKDDKDSNNEKSIVEIVDKHPDDIIESNMNVNIIEPKLTGGDTATDDEVVSTVALLDAGSVNTTTATNNENGDVVVDTVDNDDPMKSLKTETKPKSKSILADHNDVDHPTIYKNDTEQSSSMIVDQEDACSTELQQPPVVVDGGVDTDAMDIDRTTSKTEREDEVDDPRIESRMDLEPKTTSESKIMMEVDATPSKNKSAVVDSRKTEAVDVLVELDVTEEDIDPSSNVQRKEELKSDIPEQSCSNTTIEDTSRVKSGGTAFEKTMDIDPVVLSGIETKGKDMPTKTVSIMDLDPTSLLPTNTSTIVMETKEKIGEVLEPSIVMKLVPGEAPPKSSKQSTSPVPSDAIMKDEKNDTEQRVVDIVATQDEPMTTISLMSSSAGEGVGARPATQIQKQHPIPSEIDSESSLSLVTKSSGLLLSTEQPFSQQHPQQQEYSRSQLLVVKSQPPPPLLFLQQQQQQEPPPLRLPEPLFWSWYAAEEHFRLVRNAFLLKQRSSSLLQVVPVPLPPPPTATMAMIPSSSSSQQHPLQRPPSNNSTSTTTNQQLKSSKLPTMTKSNSNISGNSTSSSTGGSTKKKKTNATTTLNTMTGTNMNSPPNKKIKLDSALVGSMAPYSSTMTNNSNHIIASSNNNTALTIPTSFGTNHHLPSINLHYYLLTWNKYLKDYTKAGCLTPTIPVGVTKKILPMPYNHYYNMIPHHQHQVIHHHNHYPLMLPMEPIQQQQQMLQQRRHSGSGGGGGWLTNAQQQQLSLPMPHLQQQQQQQQPFQFTMSYQPPLMTSSMQKGGMELSVVGNYHPQSQSSNRLLPNIPTSSTTTTMGTTTTTTTNKKTASSQSKTKGQQQPSSSDSNKKQKKIPNSVYNNNNDFATTQEDYDTRNPNTIRWNNQQQYPYLSNNNTNPSHHHSSSTSSSQSPMHHNTTSSTGSCGTGPAQAVGVLQHTSSSSNNTTKSTKNQWTITDEKQWKQKLKRVLCTVEQWMIQYRINRQTYWLDRKRNEQYYMKKRQIQLKCSASNTTRNFTSSTGSSLHNNINNPWQSELGGSVGHVFGAIFQNNGVGDGDNRMMKLPQRFIEDDDHDEQPTSSVVCMLCKRCNINNSEIATYDDEDDDEDDDFQNLWTILNTTSRRKKKKKSRRQQQQQRHEDKKRRNVFTLTTPEYNNNNNNNVDYYDDDSGDNFIQCLECDFVGCAPSHLSSGNQKKNKSKTTDHNNAHIVQHMLQSKHFFGVSCGPRARIYSFQSGEYVNHIVFEEEKFRLDIAANLPWLGWPEQPVQRSFDPFQFIRVPDQGVFWKGMNATYPVLVLPEHYTVAQLCRYRQIMFHGNVPELPYALRCSNEQIIKFTKKQRQKPISTRCIIQAPVGFYNVGHTCAMSAVLQCLVHCSPLQRYFLRDVRHHHLAHEIYRQLDWETLKLSSSSYDSTSNNGNITSSDKNNGHHLNNNDTVCLASEMDKLFLEYYGSSIGFDVLSLIQSTKGDCASGTGVDTITNSTSESPAVSQPGQPLLLTDMLRSVWSCRGMKHLAGYDQRDAHEFLHGFLEMLGKHTQRHQSYIDFAVKYIEAPSISPILNVGSVADRTVQKDTNHGDIAKNLFEGTLRSVLICQHCRNKRVQFERFMSISLPLSKEVHKLTQETGEGKKLSVERCLKHFTLPELLTDPVYCPSCKQKTVTKKQHVVSRLPKILCLHLKRFDATLNKKIEDFVSFPGKGLNMGPYLPHWSEASSVQLPDDDEDDDVGALPNISYDLFGTVNHYGNLESGHYVANVRVKDRWYHCNDSYVGYASKSNEEEAVLNSEGAYLLFYSKRKP